jgi:Fe2+ or Zn2+ uptake regulation protein
MNHKHHYITKCDKCGASLECFTNDEKQAEKDIKRFEKQHKNCGVKRSD